MIKRTVFSIVAFTSILFFSCSDSSSVNAQSNRITPEKIFMSNWSEVALPNSSIKMNVPFQLTYKSIPIPEQVKSIIKSLESQEYKLGTDFYMLSASTEYRNSEINLSNAANEAMSNLKRQGYISNVEFTERRTTVSGLSAIKQNGTYFESGRKVEFTNYIIVNGTKMNSVIITNNSNSEYGGKIRQKIEQSL